MVNDTHVLVKRDACDQITTSTIALLQCNVHTHHFFMYITVPHRSSSCVKKLHVDALAGKALVEFKDTGHYEYENVSRRAIINVLFNPEISLGFWVNNNCTKSDRAQLSDGFSGRAIELGVLS